MDERFEKGTYRGLAWSRLAPKEICEMQCDIDDNGVKLWIATGTDIQTTIVARTDIHSLPAEELPRDSDVHGDVTAGIRLGDTGWVFLLLSELTHEEINEDLAPGTEPTPPTDIAGIHVLGFPDEGIYGPSVLFTPSQVAAGGFDHLVERLERELGHHVLTRLELGGKTE